MRRGQDFESEAMINELSRTIQSLWRMDAPDSRSVHPYAANVNADALVWHVLESPAPEGALLPDGFEAA